MGAVDDDAAQIRGAPVRRRRGDRPRAPGGVCGRLLPRGDLVHIDGCALGPMHPEIRMTNRRSWVLKYLLVFALLLAFLAGIRLDLISY